MRFRNKMAGSRCNEIVLMQRLLAPFRKIAALMLRKKTNPFVRFAAQKDSPTLARLHKDGGFGQHWTAQDFEVFLADRSVIADILCDPAHPPTAYGFILSRKIAHEAEILTIVLARTIRGRGWARVLLSRHLARLGQEGVETLFLEVEEDNRPARALYQSSGFVTVGKRPGYYVKAGGQTANALIMKRDLDRI